LLHRVIESGSFSEGDVCFDIIPLNPHPLVSIKKMTVWWKLFCFPQCCSLVFCYGTRDDIVFPCKLDESVLRLVSFAYGLEALQATCEI